MYKKKIYIYIYTFIYRNFASCARILFGLLPRESWPGGSFFYYYAADDATAARSHLFYFRRPLSIIIVGRVRDSTQQRIPTRVRLNVLSPPAIRFRSCGGFFLSRGVFFLSRGGFFLSCFVLSPLEYTPADNFGSLRRRYPPFRTKIHRTK